MAYGVGFHQRHMISVTLQDCWNRAELEAEPHRGIEQAVHHLHSLAICSNRLRSHRGYSEGFGYLNKIRASHLSQ